MQNCFNSGWTSRRKSTLPESSRDWTEVKDNPVSASAATKHFKTPNAVTYMIESRFLMTNYKLTGSRECLLTINSKRCQWVVRVGKVIRQIYLILGDGAKPSDSAKRPKQSAKS